MQFGFAGDIQVKVPHCSRCGASRPATPLRLCNDCGMERAACHAVAAMLRVCATRQERPRQQPSLGRKFKLANIPQYREMVKQRKADRANDRRKRALARLAEARAKREGKATKGKTP